jgi:hypothetical protein
LTVFTASCSNVVVGVTIGEESEVAIKCAGSDSTTRSFLLGAFAFGLAVAVASTAYAGPAPPCHLFCTLDKKCSVGGGATQDSCVAEEGAEVTYIYEVLAGNWVWEIEDDKLGVIGQSGGETLTRTATLTSTTTNYAWMNYVRALDSPPYPGSDCICCGPSKERTPSR